MECCHCFQRYRIYLQLLPNSSSGTSPAAAVMMNVLHANNVSEATLINKMVDGNLRRTNLKVKYREEELKWTRSGGDESALHIITRK